MKNADHYKIRLDVFEGPLDLLLYLIDKEEIDIYDIPITLITEQYLKYLELFRLLDLNIAGEYLVMAATLMQIKSRMLLPVEENPDEGLEGLDPRNELVSRLLEYKKFKEVAGELSGLALEREKIFTRQSSLRIEDDIPDDAPIVEASLFDLITAFSKILQVVSEEIFHEVLEDEYSIGDKIIELSGLLMTEKKVLFESLFRASKNKMEIITIFLALLELIRLQRATILQSKDFDTIEILSKMTAPEGREKS